MRLLSYNSADFHAQLRRFCGRSDTDPKVVRTVFEVLREVRRRGDRAVLRFTEKYDGARLRAADLPVSAGEMLKARKALTPPQRKAIKSALRCVKEFQRPGLPKSWRGTNPQGARVGEIFYPIERVGIYVPGGSGPPLVSTVLMIATLARMAKVPQIVVCTPPRPDGSVASGLLAALNICGIKEVYRIGGIQAIGAMAYGTRSVRQVDKIFGPGSSHVNEAKRQVFGDVGIDLLAGPSEIMVIADGSARASYVAADLLAQAEHDPRCKIYLVTTSKGLINAVQSKVKTGAAALSRSKTIGAVLRSGCFAVHVNNLEQAAEVANIVSPEHLELHVKNNRLDPLIKKIRCAGAILVGEFTPTVIADYTAGPSHILPTGRAARFCSGLQVSDFFRRSSIVQYNPRSLARAREVVEAFSEIEQLDAHGRSLQIRLQQAK